MIIKIVYKATTRRDFLLTIDDWTKDDYFYYFLYRGEVVHKEKRSDVKAVKAI